MGHCGLVDLGARDFLFDIFDLLHESHGAVAAAEADSRLESGKATRGRLGCVCGICAEFCVQN